MTRRKMVLFAAAYVVVALLLGWQGGNQGSWLFGSTVSALSSASATAMLSAVASGMIAFAGIVFSLAFVALQFGTSMYGPRVVEEVGRSGLMPHALGVFTGTFLYALMAIRTVDIDGGPGVNTLIVGISMAWLMASVLLSVLLLPSVAAMSISRVLTLLGKRGRDAAARLFPRCEGSVPTAGSSAEASAVDAAVRQVVLHEGCPKYIVGFDAAGLVEAATRAGVVVEVPYAIGDCILPGEPLAVVRGGRASISEERIRRAVWLDIERVTANDPGYALRVLVDTAIRALSPAINDPTTAVNVLDQIQPILAELGRSRLDVGHVRDRGNAVRFVFSHTTWDEFVQLALGEIQQYGRDSRQVQQRLDALVRGLLEALPPERHPALLRVVGYEPEPRPTPPGVGVA